MPINHHFETRTERPSLNSPCNVILIIFKSCCWKKETGIGKQQRDEKTPQENIPGDNSPEEGKEVCFEGT